MAALERSYWLERKGAYIINRSSISVDTAAFPLPPSFYYAWAYRIVGAHLLFFILSFMVKRVSFSRPLDYLNVGDVMRRQVEHATYDFL